MRTTPGRQLGQGPRIRGTGAKLALIGVLLGVATTAAGEAVQYQYDALRRLASVCFADQSKLVTYTYDAAGNRKQVTTTGVACGTTSFVIDGPVSVRAGQVATFKVRRLGATSGTNAVSYATANDTAIAGTHYTAASGSLTFAAGDYEKSFTVTTTAGSVPSGTVSLFANLSNPTNGATLQAAQTAGTLRANAPPVATTDWVTGSWYVFETVPVYVLANDGDVDGDTLTITSATCLSGGCNVSVVGGQYLNVTGTTTAPADKTVRYWISDGQGGTAEATATLVEFWEEEPGCGEFQC